MKLCKIFDLVFPLTIFVICKQMKNYNAKKYVKPLLLSKSEEGMSLQQRIDEKKKELQLLTQVKFLAAQLSTQLEQLEAKLDVLSDGSESVALILSNWNHIIKSVSLASMSLMNYNETDYENKEDPPLPETLVRLRIDDDSE